MANFPNMVITNVGRNMITRAGSGQTNDRLIVTRIDLGNGVYSGDIRSLTAIVSKKMSATITSYSNLGNGKWKYEFQYDNSTLSVGFEHREVGVFAKNGDTGTEQLLAYSNAGNQYTYLRAKDEAIPLQTLIIYLALGDLTNVAATVDVSNAVKIQQLNAAIDAHNSDTNTHANLFTIDSTTVDDTSIKGSTAIQKLGARVKWVKSYVENKIKTFTEFTASQIKDFNAKILEYLLSNVAESAISTLNSDSLIAKLVKKVLQVSGVRYSLGDNGYIVFGQFFGNFCIQWVRRGYENSDIQKVKLPIEMSILAKLVISANQYSTSNEKGCFVELKTSDGNGTPYFSKNNFWFTQYKDGLPIYVGEYYAYAAGIAA